jgi:hypothetical protein
VTVEVSGRDEHNVSGTELCTFEKPCKGIKTALYFCVIYSHLFCHLFLSLVYTGLVLARVLARVLNHYITKQLVRVHT